MGIRHHDRKGNTSSSIGQGLQARWHRVHSMTDHPRELMNRPKQTNGHRTLEFFNFTNAFTATSNHGLRVANLVFVAES